MIIKNDLTSTAIEPDSVLTLVQQHVQTAASPRIGGKRKWDLACDLSRDIGSLHWFRGLATMLGLGALAIGLAPGITPVRGALTIPMQGDDFEETRAQMIMPLAFGGDSGRRSGPTEMVRRLASSPETPTEELSGVLGRGENFSRVLERAGVSGADRSKALAIVQSYTDLAAIEPGTRIDIVLGERADKNSARPLESLSFRARLDLALTLQRTPSGLIANAKNIAVDSTPLRIRARVGNGIFNSARAAGASSHVVQQYLELLDKAGLLDTARPDDELDLVIEHRRAETGETRLGRMVYGGLIRDNKAKMSQVFWRGQFWEASGVGQSRGELMRPVNGRITSYYGGRRHPILGYVRMHAGIDFGAAHGTPIYAATSGRVVYSGRHGGHGNYVKINHGGALATGYAHMSRITAGVGQSVRQGQIIGYVGSTGLSTGPHLHYEVYRNGATINPMSVKFVERAQLSGDDLRLFKAYHASLMNVATGAATLQSAAPQKKEPTREIDRLAKTIN